MCEGLLAVALMGTSSSGFNGDIIITSQIVHSTISGRVRGGGGRGGHMSPGAGVEGAPK